MANTYTYSGPATRWSEGDPTAVDYLNVSRVNSDHLYEALNTIIVSASVTAGAATALKDGTTATTQSASDNSTKIATTAYADAAAPSYQTMSLSDTFKIEVRTASDSGGQVIWSLGWFKSSDGRWWLLGNTANVDTFARGDAEFYIPTGDISDVPSS